MKKYLTKVLSFAMILVCFFVAGCSAKDISGEKAINVCKSYMDELAAISTAIKDNEFVYPQEAAINAAIPVEETELSKYGIPYSEYEDFNFDQDPESFGLITPKVLYGGGITVITNLNDYLDNLDKKTFEIGNAYKFVFEKENSSSAPDIEYFATKLSGKTLYIYQEKPTSTGTFYAQYTIKLTGTTVWDWVSVERKSISYNTNGDVSYYHHFVIEQSTDINRVIDRCAVINYKMLAAGYGTKDQISSFDFEEKTQKMIFIEDTFLPGEATGNSKTLCDYMDAINYAEFTNVINKTTAETITVPYNAPVQA